MKCEFDYCLYNEKLACTLAEIRINPWGMCDECEIIGLSIEILEMHKKKQLKELKERWEKYDES